MSRIRLTTVVLALVPVLAGCASGRMCPAIATFRGITVVVGADLAPQVGSLAVRACQAGTCKQETLVLVPGSLPLPSRCQSGQEEPCNASATPDGTLVGNLSLPDLTEEALDVTVTGSDKSGTGLPARSIKVHPASTQPFGKDCPAFGPQASLHLGLAGLSESPAR